MHKLGLQKPAGLNLAHEAYKAMTHSDHEYFTALSQTWHFTQDELDTLLKRAVTHQSSPEIWTTRLLDLGANPNQDDGHLFYKLMAADNRSCTEIFINYGVSLKTLYDTLPIFNLPEWFQYIVRHRNLPPHHKDPDPKIFSNKNSLKVHISVLLTTRQLAQTAALLDYLNPLLKQPVYRKALKELREDLLSYGTTMPYARSIETFLNHYIEKLRS